ncbi:MAG: choice-of-anchor J domain-containing protein [Bacteroidales bacterium]|nr:choice-of-anchor J domain-containing protein [Bacteroidales bacterium]
MRKLLLISAMLLLWAGSSWGQNLNESFSDVTFPPEGWAKYRGTNNIGTLRDWDRYTLNPRTAPASASVNYEAVSGGLAEDWLVTPKLSVSEGNNTLTFWIRDQFTTNYGSILYVKASNASQNTHADFTDIISYPEPGTTYIQKIVDLSAYNGQDIYIAFVWVNDDGDRLYLDDVSGPPIYVPTVPVFSINPISWDFGTVEAQGMPVTKDFIIKNEGGGTLSITDISISTVVAAPNEFTLVNPPASIELGLFESTTLTVAFSPNSPGVRTATIDLNSNARIIRKVELTGAGIDLTGLLFSQGVNFSGTAITSTLDPASQIDYEGADNFWNLDREIKSVSFFGLALKFIGGSFVQQVPNPQEPFIIRFYNYVEAYVPGLTATTAGTYQIVLLDDWGDGWNGGKVTVFVNGSAVLTDLTILSGAGPVYHDFIVEIGDEISTIYIPGSWSYENYYAILDNEANIIAEQGGTFADPGATTPSSILPGSIQALEPDWDNPAIVQNVLANVSSDGNWGSYTLYKFEADLTVPVMMQDGWFSAQIDVANGSGTWFLWNNSLDGDGLSHQRIPAVPVRNGVSRSSQDPAFVSADKTGSGYAKDQRSDDLAFDLIAESTLIPLSNWALYLGIFLIAAFAIFRFRRMI